MKRLSWLCISLLDDCFGKIIQELKERGLYDDSFILFTSDHGKMLGSHWMWQKICMYEVSVRTPLFLKFLRKSGCEMYTGSSEVPVSVVDILPTLCDVLDVRWKCLGYR